MGKFYTGRRSFRLGPLRINTVWFLPTSVSWNGWGMNINVNRNGRLRTSFKIPFFGGTWQKSWGRGCGCIGPAALTLIVATVAAGYRTVIARLR